VTGTISNVTSNNERTARLEIYAKWSKNYEFSSEILCWCHSWSFV